MSSILAITQYIYLLSQGPQCSHMDYLHEGHGGQLEVVPCGHQQVSIVFFLNKYALLALFYYLASKKDNDMKFS